MEPISDYTLFENQSFWDSYTPSIKGYKESSREMLANANILNLLSCLDNYDDNLEGNAGRQEIADAFAAWSLRLKNGYAGNKQTLFYQLNTTDTGTDLAVAELDDPKDQNVLRHLIPAAKHYGFDVFLVQGGVYLSGEVKVEHEYKKYGESYDDGVYSWNHVDRIGIDDQTKWIVTRLDGQQVDGLDLSGFDSMLRGQGNYYPVLNYHFDINDYADAEPAIFEVDHKCYHDILYLTGTKYVSFLMIVPQSSLQ